MGLIILLLTALALLFIGGSLVLSHRITHPPRRTAASMIAHDLPADPAGFDAPFQSVQLPGVPELWLVQGDAPTGPAMLVLHGWADSRYGSLLWLDTLRPLASLIVLLDLPGHGDSPVRSCTWGKRELDDIQRVIEWLREHHPSTLLVLFGYSMGASLAVRAAARLPGSVAGVIADSPYERASDAIAALLCMMGLPAWPTVAIVANLLRRSLLLHTPTSDAAARLTCPLLVLHGEADRLTTLADAKRIANAGPTHEFASFPGADHLEAAATDPAGYAAALRQFLRQLT
jgi:pimeloyl-ACP methyl ester carboxylesterase